MADHSLISLDGLSKVFYTEEVETHALSGINMDIKGGEFVSIAGPSGCGKTTLLSILGLLDSPTGGQYLLGGVQSGIDFRVGGFLRFRRLRRWTWRRSKTLIQLDRQDRHGSLVDCKTLLDTRWTNSGTGSSSVLIPPTEIPAAS